MEEDKKVGRPSVLHYHILDVCSPLLSTIVSSSSVNTASTPISSYQLKNIALVASAMAKMQSVVGYFQSSTPAMTKLLDFQRTSHLSIYKDQHWPKKLLKDVVTRWYCSITRLRFLKKAIRSLLVVEDIECKHVTKEEWLVLDQLQIMLETMAHFQQILKGESYVTGFLVAVAVFQIRQGYVEVIECDDTEPSIKSLSKVLLTNFDTRYAPACSDTGKIKYHHEDTIGKYKRYIGCCNAILKRDVDAHHARVSVGDLGLRENLFVYFNIVCSQSKSKSSLLLLFLSKKPIARKFFDSPRLKFAKLDNFQHTSKYNNR
jgi:hypothetical protein